jgi:predicted nucleotidyltransferase
MLPATKNDSRRLTKVAEMVRVKSIYIEKEAKKHNFKVYNTENDFKKKLSDAQRFLLN